MGVQNQGEAPFTLKAGDSLLVKPGIVPEHWNDSTTEPLVFREYVLVDQGNAAPSSLGPLAKKAAISAAHDAEFVDDYPRPLFDRALFFPLLRSFLS
jgi:hypothetical protein